MASGAIFGEGPQKQQGFKLCWGATTQTVWCASTKSSKSPTGPDVIAVSALPLCECTADPAPWIIGGPFGEVREEGFAASLWGRVRRFGVRLFDRVFVATCLLLALEVRVPVLQTAWAFFNDHAAAAFDQRP